MSYATLALVVPASGFDPAGAVNIAGGAMLIAIGVLMVTGAWNVIMQSLQGWIASVVTII